MQLRSFLALLTTSAAGARPGAGGAGIGGAYHHVAAGAAAHSGVDSRGSTGDTEIATDDATAGAAHTWNPGEQGRRRQALPLPSGSAVSRQAHLFPPHRRAPPGKKRRGWNYLHTFTEPTPSHNLWVRKERR